MRYAFLACPVSLPVTFMKACIRLKNVCAKSQIAALLLRGQNELAMSCVCTSACTLKWRKVDADSLVIQYRIKENSYELLIPARQLNMRDAAILLEQVTFPKAYASYRDNAHIDSKTPADRRC